MINHRGRREHGEGKIKYYIPQTYISKQELDALVEEGVRMIKADIEAQIKRKKRK